MKLNMQSIATMGHSKKAAERYDRQNQEANIAALEILLEAAKSKEFMAHRLGQLLINMGVAQDDNAFWNASSKSLLNRVVENYTKPEGE